MGTHSDGKPVTRYGFDGPYWSAQADKAAEWESKADEHLKLHNEFRKNMILDTDIDPEPFPIVSGHFWNDERARRGNERCVSVCVGDYCDSGEYFTADELRHLGHECFEVAAWLEDK